MNSTPESSTPREGSMEIVARLREAGHEAYWVGGCVRDELLGRRPTDYDVATSATPVQIEGLFRRTIPVGRHFGVITVVHHGHAHQVATFRVDAAYEDGRHPVGVRFSAAQEDAKRRDFTVNGLFCDPRTGEITDWVGGRADLGAGLIRSIGDPRERFGEDHLRMLRAIRFAVQLGFEVEVGTLAAIREMGSLITKVSGERIREELCKVFYPGRAAEGLALLRQSGLLAHVLPEVDATHGCMQSPQYHPEGSVFEHVKLMLGLLPAESDPRLPWAVLFHDCAKPQTRAVDPDTGEIHFYGHEKLGQEFAEAAMRRLRFPRADIDAVAGVVRYHMQFKDVPQMRRSTLGRMLERPAFALELELHRLDCLGSHGRLDSYERMKSEWAAAKAEPQRVTRLVTGDDLIALGFTAGPWVGRCLAELKAEQFEGRVVDRPAALAWASAWLQRASGASEKGGAG